MNEMKLAKFETKIEDINKKIDKYAVAQLPETLANLRRRERVGLNMALTLIFNYGSCNNYAKIIMQKSKLLITSESDAFTDKWEDKYPTPEALNSPKAKIEAAKLFIQYCGESQNVEEGYKYIFWSLMILAVDKNNAGEYLSFVCDFAKMLGITDEEFEDIICTVKCVFNSVDKEYVFKSNLVPKIFNNIFNLHGNITFPAESSVSSGSSFHSSIRGIASSMNRIFGS